MQAGANSGTNHNEISYVKFPFKRNALSRPSISIIMNYSEGWWTWCWGVGGRLFPFLQLACVQIFNGDIVALNEDNV